LNLWRRTSSVSVGIGIRFLVLQPIFYQLTPLCYVGFNISSGFWWGSLRERDRWGDRGVDGRIMLGWIFEKCDVGVRTRLGWLRIGIGGGRV
jgi:hypothetical protein